jgi:hypothetical protein
MNTAIDDVIYQPASASAPKLKSKSPSLKNQTSNHALYDASSADDFVDIDRIRSLSRLYIDSEIRCSFSLSSLSSTSSSSSTQNHCDHNDTRRQFDHHISHNSIANSNSTLKLQNDDPTIYESKLSEPMQISIFIDSLCEDSSFDSSKINYDNKIQKSKNYINQQAKHDSPHNHDPISHSIHFDETIATGNSDNSKKANKNDETGAMQNALSSDYSAIQTNQSNQTADCKLNEINTTASVSYDQTPTSCNEPIQCQYSYHEVRWPKLKSLQYLLICSLIIGIIWIIFSIATYQDFLVYQKEKIISREKAAVKASVSNRIESMSEPYTVEKVDAPIHLSIGPPTKHCLTQSDKDSIKELEDQLRAAAKAAAITRQRSHSKWAHTNLLPNYD